MFLLDLVYDRTATEGPLFERMRTKLDAVAAHEGMSNVFKLRARTCCRVKRARCCQATRRSDAAAGCEARARRGIFGQPAGIADMEGLLATVLRACEGLLGSPYVRDAGGRDGRAAIHGGEHGLSVVRCGFRGADRGGADRARGGAKDAGARHAHGARAFVRACVAGGAGRRASSAIEQVIPCRGCTRPEPARDADACVHRELVGVIAMQSETPGAVSIRRTESVMAILASPQARAWRSWLLLS